MLEAVMAENGNPPAIRAGHKLMRHGQSGCPGDFGPPGFFTFASSQNAPFVFWPDFIPQQKS